jgi:hypothetical protein
VEKLLLSILNIGASDIRQIEVHTFELLVTEPSPSEVEIITANLKKYKSSGSDQFWQN